MTDPQHASVPPPPDAQEIPISQIFAILWRGRWIILLCALLATGAGVWYVEKRGTIYRAKARIKVDNQNLNVMGAEALFLGAASRNYANTQAELLRSTPILTNAIDRDALRNLEIFAGVENRLLWLAKNLKVSVGKTDDIISLTLDSKLVADACEIVNQVVAEYRLAQTEQNEDTRESLVTQLQKQKESTEVSLEERKKDLAAFLQENGSVDPQTAAMVSARYNIRLGELSRLTEERRRLQLASTTAEAFKGDPETLLRMLASDPTTRAAAMDPVSDELRLQARNYDAQLVTLRSEITDKHPAIGKLEERVAELRSELAGRQELFAKNYCASVSQSLAAVKAEEERLAAEVKADEELRQIMSNHVREIDTLDADIRDKRAAIKLLDDRITAINLNKVDKAAELKIQTVDDAYVATATVAAGKTTTVAIMGFLGLLFGAALAWLRGMLDHRIRRVEDVAQGAGLQVVGVTPRGTFRKGITALEAWQTSHGLAESARSLRTAVYFAMSAGDDHTLHVTSPDPGDGKSLTTASLAIAMAQAGQKTLIIDADLRKPRQDELWGVDNDYGLANMLQEPRARSGVIATDQPGLDLLPAGSIPDNPAELLSSDRFDKLLAKFAKKYDRVLVDSPPVLPVADSRIIGPKCDFTLLVTRVDKTTVKRAALAREDIASVGGRLLGAVVNDMPRKIGYGYGYGYGYGSVSYGYGRDTSRERRRRDEVADVDADLEDSLATHENSNGSRSSDHSRSNGVAKAAPSAATKAGDSEAAPPEPKKPTLRRVAVSGKLPRKAEGA